MRRHCLDMTAWNTPFSSGAVWARIMFAGNCLCFVLSAILLWTLVSPRAAAQVAAEPLQTPPAFSSPSPAEAEDVMAGLNTPEGTLGYALGLRIGARITADFKAQHAPINPAALARGLADAIVGRKPLLGEQQLSQALEAFEKKMQEQELALGRRMAEVAKVNKIKAAAFLEANAGQKGIVSLPSGLQYEVLKTGAGPQPQPADSVSTHYRGTHVDGTEFDGTDPKGEPAIFPLRGVVPGWQEAIVMMKVGSKWRLFVPPALAYGEEGSPPVIEPNEVLVFEIELLKILPERSGGR